MNESDSRILVLRILNDDMPVQKNKVIEKNINLTSYIRDNSNRSFGLEYVLNLIDFI